VAEVTRVSILTVGLWREKVGARFMAPVCSSVCMAGSSQVVPVITIVLVPDVCAQLVLLGGLVCALVRFIRKPFLVENPKSAEVAQSVLYRAILIYNKLDYIIKTLNPKQFSKNINKGKKKCPFDITKSDDG